MKNTALLCGISFGLFLVACTKTTTTGPLGELNGAPTPMPFIRPGGNDAGNGGDGVVCSTKGSLSYELLDFFEASVLPPTLRIDLGKSVDPLEKVEHALKRLERLDPLRANRYRFKARAFVEGTQIRWVKGIELSDIPDSGYVPLPTHCHIEQVAIQKSPVFPTDPKYVISKDWWDNFEPHQKAGLILHELVYEEMLALGHGDSIRARKFTAYLASEKFSDMTPTAYAELQAILFEKPRRLAFRARQFEYAFSSTQPFQLDLNTLVITPKAKINWSFIGTAPVDLKMQDGVVSWTPAEVVGVRQISFDVSADDGITGTLSTITFYVLGTSNYPVRWATQPFSLNLKYGQKIHFDLRSLIISNRPDEHLTFSSIGLPSWMESSRGGLLSGRAEQSGDFNGLVRVSDGDFKTWASLRVYVDR